MKFSKYPKHSDALNNLTEQELDRLLSEVDDLAGDAPGLTVSPDFLPRIVELARTETLSVHSSRTFLGWFSDFSLAMRLAVASAILLASFGGIRAGQAVTEVIARRAKQPQTEYADPLGLAISEQAIVQLIHNDGLTIQGQQNRSSGEQR